jgi:hypothetical protein
MIEGFLLDRVDTETAGAAITGKHDLPALIGPDKAETPLSFMQLAEPRANITLHPPVIQQVPVTRRYNGLIDHVIIPESQTVQVSI